MGPLFLQSVEASGSRPHFFKLCEDKAFKLEKDAGSGVVVTEESVSRNHAFIRYNPESRKWYLTKKARGSFTVNGEVIKTAEPIKLKDGMRIALDKSERHPYVVRMKSSSERKRRLSQSSNASSSDESDPVDVGAKRRKICGDLDQSSYTEIESRYSRLKEENSKLKVELRKLQTDHKRLYFENKALLDQQQQLREKEQQVKTEEVRLNESEDSRLKMELRKIQKDHKRLRCENKVLLDQQQQFHERGQQIKTEEERLKKLEESLTNKMKEVEDKESALNKAKEEVEAARLAQEQELYDSVKQQVMLQFTDIMENELQCSICTEYFINPVLLKCTHSFCSHCIRLWKKKNNACPVCRTKISVMLDNAALKHFLEQALMLFPEEFKQKRRETQAEIASLAAEGTKSTVDDQEISSVAEEEWILPEEEEEEGGSTHSAEETFEELPTDSEEEEATDSEEEWIAPQEEPAVQSNRRVLRTRRTRVRRRQVRNTRNRQSALQRYRSALQRRYRNNILQPY